jgi:hypothetical protein
MVANWAWHGSAYGMGDFGNNGFIRPNERVLQVLLRDNELAFVLSNRMFFNSNILWPPISFCIHSTTAVVSTRFLPPKLSSTAPTIDQAPTNSWPLPMLKPMTATYCA